MPSRFQATLRTATILHLALVMSVAMYGVALWFVAGTGRGMVLNLNLVLPAAAASALLVAAGAALLRRSSLSQRREPAGIEEEGDLSLEDPASQAAAGRWHTTNILTWALCEVVALHGFILSFLSHDLRIYAGFAVAAWILMAAWRPRAVDLRELVLGARS